ncbi:hypothetical protein Ciccas_004460 [Cichlidogyrus casuarinus]|uniref:Uncharacterized protein n=1 Tax=Cichlidogyrus casuarinus TaxID=1844966 RepID=A0ABD2QCE8_9PLAT
MIQSYLDLEYKDFQKLIYNAENIARYLPNKDLLKAFSLTLDMMKLLGDLMHSSGIQEIKEAPALFDHRSRSYEHGFNGAFPSASSFRNRHTSPPMKYNHDSVEDSLTCKVCMREENLYRL